MHPATRILAAALTTGALLAGPHAAASAGPAARAATPTVKYADVKVKCSTVTYDGVDSRQCQAILTVSAARVAKGYVVTLFQKSQYGPSQVLQFEASGPKAHKRTPAPGVVCSTTEGDEKTTHYQHYTVVKDASGKTVLRTKPVQFC